MRTLYLLLHAKSSWSDKGADDHDRPLNARGEDAARRMGAYLREAGLTPDLILSSTSRRTRETVDGILPFLPDKTAARFTRALYLASPEAMLSTLREEGDEAGTVMLVGHNP